MQKELRHDSDFIRTHTSHYSGLDSGQRPRRPAEARPRIQNCVAPYSAKFSASRMPNDASLAILAQLEAENSELRNQAVELALQIQELSYRAKG